MENLLNYLQVDLTGALTTLMPIILALVVSFVLGMLIHYVYQRSFRGVIYNQAFSVSLALLTILTTMITLAISSNIALSLGMVGALSIVRYRTAIKDPADLIFLFWAVGTGITIGAHLHYLALVGALVVGHLQMRSSY
jgi:ABC-type spermidine/putrescine transport system permease subunit II